MTTTDAISYCVCVPGWVQGGVGLRSSGKETKVESNITIYDSIQLTKKVALHVQHFIQQMMRWNKEPALEWSAMSQGQSISI